MMAVGSVAKIGTAKKYCQGKLLFDSPKVATASRITKIRRGKNAFILVPTQPAINGRMIPSELPTIKMLSLKYDVICISEGPKIDSKFFIHETISFKRKPSIYHDIKCFFQLLKIFINHKEISKIVISTPKISFISALACRIYQKPYIYLHRGAVYQNYKGLKLKIYKAIDKFIIKGSENTTFISKSLFAWVAKTLNLTNIINKRNFNSSKGVDLKKFFPIPKKLSSPKIVIGFCGRIVKDKGYNELIELIEDSAEEDLRDAIEQIYLSELRSVEEMRLLVG